MTDAIIFDGIRTAFGRHAGALAPVRPDELLAAAIRAMVERNSFDGSLVEDVIAGDTNQAGEDARNVARTAALLAGLPSTVAGATVNRLCGSGMAAALDVARAVQCGQGQLFIAGGVESMSRSPWVLAKAESAYSRAQPMFDSTIGWRFPNPRFLKKFGDDSMSDTADNVALEHGISRADSDAYAYASQQRYAKARAGGFFQDEILPVEVPAARRKDPPIVVREDEHPRPETTLEQLAKLSPLKEGGVVTAGNASGINDGAGALLIGSRELGGKLGLKARARILSGAVAGVAPRIMGLGPVSASQKVLQRAGLSLKDMDVIEINEAFASQVLGCLKLLNLAYDDPRVNPNGGAIAIGHPLGASGIRVILTALRQLERIGGRYALVSLCIGIGQGIAVIIERERD
ncbi:MAG: 3-oxoadipyl-CoA thiolase [Gammaproteobacteria bacterium]|jgi:acetyl-CoA C-acetyltransferase|nr:MAG: 3-oxoadipyl-CoA thiolase [Gammaproteobacteria bacterium]